MKKLFEHKITLNVVRLNKLALGLGIGVLSVVLYIILTLPSAKAQEKNTQEIEEYRTVNTEENTVPRELLSASNAVPGYEYSANDVVDHFPAISTQEKVLPEFEHEGSQRDQSLRVAYASPLSMHSTTEKIDQSSTRLVDQASIALSLLNPLPYTLQAGSLIPSILQSGINSDLSGELVAIVRHPVFDSVSGKYLLIPQGSRLLLVYDNKIVMGQQRLIVAAKRLLFPNGKSLDLGGMPTIDDVGMMGLKDKVDNHFLRLFGSSLLIGLISGGVQLAQPKMTQDHPTSVDVISGSVGMQLSQTAMNVVDRQSSIQPTLIIRPGQTFNIQLSKDLVFTEHYLGHEND